MKVIFKGVTKQQIYSFKQILVCLRQTLSRFLKNYINITGHTYSHGEAAMRIIVDLPPCIKSLTSWCKSMKISMIKKSQNMIILFIDLNSIIKHLSIIKKNSSKEYKAKLTM